MTKMSRLMSELRDEMEQKGAILNDPQNLTVHLTVGQYLALRGEDTYTFEARWGVATLYERRAGRGGYRLTGPRPALRRLLEDALRRGHDSRKGSALRNAISLIQAALYSRAVKP